MKFDPHRHHRRSIRLKEYDYSQPGGYFVTIVSYQRDCLFGEIVNRVTQLNEYGRIVDECWRAIPDHFTNTGLGAYVVMPNHIHGIIVINDNKNRMATDPKCKTWFIWCNRPFIQIRRYATHWARIKCDRHVATQLSRTCDS